MFVTNDSELYERVLTLSNHGRQRGQVRQFWPDAVGFKYKMSNVSAAIGCAQLERIDDLVARKQEIFRAYRKLLSGLPLVLNPPDTPGLTHGYWMPAAVVVGIPEFERQALLRCFEASHIDGRVFFWPLSWTGHFQVRHDIPVSRAISPYGVNLPTYHDMTQEDIDRVVAVLTNFLNQ
jgi:perosamine synthetase